MRVMGRNDVVLMVGLTVALFRNIFGPYLTSSTM